MRKAEIRELLRGCTAEEQSALQRLCRGQGFCAARPDVAIAGKAFCFTGRSQRASREAMSQAVAALGGTVHPRVTRATDYLVVCSEGSPTWECGTYGSKIRRAAHIRSGGGKVTIISERNFWEACEREGAIQRAFFSHPDRMFYTEPVNNGIISTIKAKEPGATAPGDRGKAERSTR